MDDQRFDELTRVLGRANLNRRGLIGGTATAFLAVLAKAVAPRVAAAKGQARVTICHKGREIEVAAAAVPAHLAHGDHLGACSEVPGPQLCSHATSPCDPNPTSCGQNCSCITTTSGGSICATNEKVCLAGESTCSVDSDCVSRFGKGFACVATTGCIGLTCGGNGNACVPSCQG